MVSVQKSVLLRASAGADAVAGAFTPAAASFFSVFPTIPCSSSSNRSRGKLSQSQPRSAAAAAAVHCVARSRQQQQQQQSVCYVLTQQPSCRLTACLSDYTTA
jgi:hypothetical protein